MHDRQVWLVTGCSGDLGRHIADAVIAAGRCLAATARDATRLDELAHAYGDRICTMPLDVTDPYAARGAVSLAVERSGCLDVVVNNAGYADLATIEDMTDRALRDQRGVNFFGVCIVSRAALPFMRRQRAGHIIQISLVGGFYKVLAKEVRDFGIQVTIVAPGSMRTYWAESAMTISSVSDAYKPGIKLVAARLSRIDGAQAGDPARVARALLGTAGSPNAPLRLLVGRDAVAVAVQRQPFVRKKIRNGAN